jgi:hypothetical protein
LRQSACMRRGSATPVVPATGIVIIGIAIRLAISQCSESPGVWWPVRDGVKRCVAGVAAAVLGCEQPSVGPVDRQRCFASSRGPVVGQGWVIERRPVSDHLVADDVGPGEAVQVGAACAVAEHPPVSPGLVEHAEVPGDHPGRWLVAVCQGPSDRERAPLCLRGPRRPPVATAALSV